MTIRLDTDKAVESILYIAKNVKNPTFHTISKVLYFADQLHIVKYGRFIVGDQYIAMKNGPVPSSIYDMLKYVRGDRSSCPSPKIRDLFSVKQNYVVVPYRDADLDEFSDSDIECLDMSISENGDLSFDELTKKSHDRVYDCADMNDCIPFEAFFQLARSSKDLEDYIKGQY